MIQWLYLIGQLCVLSHCVNGKATASAQPLFVEVAEGKTAKLSCPSNDDDHRFQFWQLNSNQILGPSNRLDKRKYRYEVLSGTLYINKVTEAEKGIYTCYCRHIANTTFDAKSVLLVVKNDWQKLWAYDYSSNMARLGIVGATLLIIAFVIYVIYNRLTRDELMRFRDLGDDNTLTDEISLRKASYSLSRNGKDIEMKEGIDNPAMDLHLSREITPTYNYNSTN